MIEIGNVSSCITKEDNNIDKLKKLKTITYLSKENIVEKKLDNKYVNNKKNNMKVVIKINNFTNNNTQKKIMQQNKNYYFYKKNTKQFHKIKKIIYIREKKIERYKNFKEKIKNNIKNRTLRYNEIMNLMRKKIKKTSYLKNSKIKL